jgi:hypothetical protein
LLKSIYKSITTTLEAYNNQSTIKVSPQLDHENYNYELITENHRYKATVKDGPIALA